jgi:hypothetical protein
VQVQDKSKARNKTPNRRAEIPIIGTANIPTTWITRKFRGKKRRIQKKKGYGQRNT